MKTAPKYWIIIILLLAVTACGENPKNTFGGPSNNPHDTATTSRDTSAVGTRTDGNEDNR
jgi:predicted small lipoprotein YifL